MSASSDQSGGVSSAPKPRKAAKRKPTSTKQIAANKRNASKSSGPRSEEGKARSSRNAMTHGAWAANICPIPDGAYAEDPFEFSVFVQSIIEGMCPRDALEVQAAKQVALAYARLDRLDRLEADLAATDGSISSPRVQRIANPELFLSKLAGADSTGAKPVEWMGTRQHVENLRRVVSQMLDVLRQPDDVDSWEPEWELLARLVRTHNGKSDAGVKDLWTDYCTPQSPEDWKRAFVTLHRHHWPDVDDAIAWAVQFGTKELDRFGRIAGRALAAAATTTFENSFGRAAQLRTRVTRDLLVHLRIYSQLQDRSIDSDPTTEA